MEILKPTDADKENFRSVVPDDPRAEVKAMFGKGIIPDGAKPEVRAPISCHTLSVL